MFLFSVDTKEESLNCELAPVSDRQHKNVFLRCSAKPRGDARVSALSLPCTKKKRLISLCDFFDSFYKSLAGTSVKGAVFSYSLGQQLKCIGVVHSIRDTWRKQTFAPSIAWLVETSWAPIRFWDFMQEKWRNFCVAATWERTNFLCLAEFKSLKLTLMNLPNARLESASSRLCL